MSVIALVEIAVRLDQDPEATAAVLQDAVLESGWTHRFILPLATGCALDDEPPFVRLFTQRELSTWRRARQRAHRRARGVKNERRLRGSPEWARAVLAALLFGDWPGPRKDSRRGESRSPWPLVAKNAREVYGEIGWRKSAVADVRWEAAACIRTLVQRFEATSNWSDFFESAFPLMTKPLLPLLREHVPEQLLSRLVTATIERDPTTSFAQQSEAEP